MAPEMMPAKVQALETARQRITAAEAQRTPSPYLEYDPDLLPPSVYQARVDDMIVSAGYNIAGPEVEWALLAHPAVPRAVNPDTILEFGLIPELVGRLPVLSSLQPLDETALVKVLKEPKNALLRQYQKLFAMERVELEFEVGGRRLRATKQFIRGNLGAGVLSYEYREEPVPVRAEMHETDAGDHLGYRRCVGARPGALERVSALRGLRAPGGRGAGHRCADRAGAGPAVLCCL